MGCGSCAVIRRVVKTDLESLIRQDNWPAEMAALAREIAAMPAGRARFDRLPELDAWVKRTGFSTEAFSRYMCWQVATFTECRYITNNPEAARYGAEYAEEPPDLPGRPDSDT